MMIVYAASFWYTSAFTVLVNIWTSVKTIKSLFINVYLETIEIWSNYWIFIDRISYLMSYFVLSTIDKSCCRYEAFVLNLRGISRSAGQENLGIYCSDSRLLISRYE